MPLYSVTITVRTATGEVTSYARRQRAASEVSAKWSVLRWWGTRRESQALNVQQIELTAAPTLLAAVFKAP